MLIAACSEQPERTEQRITVVPAMPAPVQKTSVAVAPHPTASPSPTPARARRAFVDPPLPAELVDPPGLLPLPPRPTFTDNQQGEMP